MVYSICPYDFDVSDWVSPEFELLSKHVLHGAFLQLGDLDVRRIGAMVTDTDARRRFFVIMETLGRAQRIVTCGNVHEEVSGICSIIAELCNANLVVCGRSVATGYAPAIMLCDYPLSDYPERIMQRDYSVLDIKTESYWEANVLSPLLRYANRFHLVDRAAGQYWNNVYEDTIRWIVRYARRMCPKLGKVTFYTSCSDGHVLANIQDLCKRESIALENKRPTTLPHARYLLTDHLGMVVDSGFRLLEGGNVNPSELWLRNDPMSILNRFAGAERLTVLAVRRGGRP